MASINRSKAPNGVEKWRARIRRKGVTKSSNFDLLSDAQAWVRATEAAIDRGDVRPVPKAQRNFGDALRRYRDEISVKHRGHEQEKWRLKKLLRDPIASIALTDLAPKHLADWREREIKATSNANASRYMSILRTTCHTAAAEWGWLTHDPIRDVKPPPGTKPRTRRPSAEEIEALCSELDWREAMPKTNRQTTALAFLIGIETAMRASEILSLCKDNMHLTQRYVQLLLTKNGDDRKVPLSARGVALMRFVPATGFEIETADMGQVFRRATEALEIEDLHFHDTRREGCTRMAKKLSVIELARVTGHRDPKSLMVYYHPDVQDLADKL